MTLHLMRGQSGRRLLRAFPKCRRPRYEAEIDRSSRYLGAGHWLVGGPGGYIVIDVDGPQG